MTPAVVRVLVEIVDPVASSQADVTVSEGVSGISGEDCPF